jgi:hypothetical protein
MRIGAGNFGKTQCVGSVDHSAGETDGECSSKQSVLAELEALHRDRHARSQTDLGRFCRCQQLQKCRPACRCSPGVRKLEKWNPANTAGRFVTTPELMPPGTGVVIPELGDLQPELQWVSDDRSLVTLAKTLLEPEIAVPRDWSLSRKDPSKYLATTVRRWIERYGGKQIRRRFDLHLTIADTILAYPDRNAAHGKLFLIVDPESAGYVVLKQSFELLESVQPHLPATLFDYLVGSLNRWLRVYDYRDAEDHVEMLREWASVDGSPDEYELPNVETCTPKCVKERSLGICSIKRIQTETSNATVRGILAAMLRLHGRTECRTT